MHSAPLFVGPLIFGALALAFNVLRFGSLQDFGYRFMIVPPVFANDFWSSGRSLSPTSSGIFSLSACSHRCLFAILWGRRRSRSW